MLDDDDESRNEGVVMVAAEHCDAGHVNFMARQARGLVCLTLTEERCRQLDLPPPPEITMAEAEQRFSPMRLSFLKDQRRVDTTKMRNVLGVVPKYSNPADGIAASLPG